MYSACDGQSSGATIRGGRPKSPSSAAVATRTAPSRWQCSSAFRHVRKSNKRKMSHSERLPLVDPRAPTHQEIWRPDGGRQHRLRGRQGRGVRPEEAERLALGELAVDAVYRIDFEVA